MSSAVGRATKTPRLGMRVTIRSALSVEKASRRVLRDTPSASHSGSSLSLVPGGSCPAAIRSRSTPDTQRPVSAWRPATVW